MNKIKIRSYYVRTQTLSASPCTKYSPQTQNNYTEMFIMTTETQLCLDFIRVLNNSITPNSFWIILSHGDAAQYCVKHDSLTPKEIKNLYDNYRAHTLT